MPREDVDRIRFANYVVGSAVHPDTQQVIPFYMRMSGFVVFNVPLVFAVLFVKNQTPAFNAAMQLANQTYNAGMNYGNRNASSTYTLKDLGRGYCGAVATSVGIVLAARTLLAKKIATLRGPRLILMNALLNYFAGASAGAANLALMRSKELKEGITVQNKEGTVDYGKSVKAGRKAIMETALSRFVLPLPVLFFPAVANSLLHKLRIMPKGNVQAKFVELMLVSISLSLALPMSIALFE